MLWLVILVALAIPLAAVVLDSPVVRALADRARQGSNPGLQGLPAGDIKHLEDKVETLETELEVMNREIAHLKESQQYFQQLLEDPAARRDAAAKLPKPKD
jgi:uncharacterized protein involved in exopolysaccharide biosynthesis